MYHWTEGEVSQVVELVSRSVRDATEATGAGRSALMSGLANALCASGWQVHMGRLTPTHDGPGLLWTVDQSEEASMHGCSSSALDDRYPEVIDRISRHSLTRDEAVVEIATRQCDCATEGTHYALACLTMSPDGLCKCFEFLRLNCAGPFTIRDHALLRILSKELDADPTPPQVDQAREYEFSDLPRRQREVLANLLLGLNAKEIARHMGLSPYTINDYIKALYRRYQVSSRGELMAAIHGHRRLVTPK